MDQNITSYATFKVVEKTLSKVIDLLLKNPSLKKLLYYSDKQALGLPTLNQEQSFSLINNQLRIVPKFDISPDDKPFVVIGLDDFVPVEGQTTLKTAVLSFDILCNYDRWLLEDFQLRPVAIAGEIDGMINTSFKNKGGIAKFMNMKQLILNSYFGGYSLYYSLDIFFDDIEKQKVGN